MTERPDRGGGTAKLSIEQQAQILAGAPPEWIREDMLIPSDRAFFSASRHSPPDLTTATPGHTCSPQCRRLNPHFVEWLMGYPIGWTDSAASETPSSPKPPPTLGELLRIGFE